MLVLSDLRVQPLPEVLGWAESLAERLDLVLYAGDDIGRFHTSSTNYLEQFAALSQYGLCAVAGNDSGVEEKRLIQGESVYDVHDTPFAVGSVCVIGLEGAERHGGQMNPGSLIYDCKEARQHLQHASELAGERDLIVLSHAPPYGVLDRAVRFGRMERSLRAVSTNEEALQEHPGPNSRSVGSRALRDFAKANEAVRLIVCGHVHGMGAQHAEIGTALVANAASHDHRGAPARVGIVGLRFGGEIGKPEWHEVASSGENVQRLTTLPGIGGTSAEHLLNCGISSLEALAETPVDELHEVVASRPWRRIQARAQAHVTDQPVAIGEPRLPEGSRIYIDIETDLDQKSLVWLIGVHLTGEDEVRYFLAETPGDERAMLTSFLKFLDENSDAEILHYSTTQFDQHTLEARLEAHSLSIPSVLSESTDVGLELQRSVALPTSSHKLTEVAEYVGYTFAHPSADGRLVASTYLRHLRVGKTLPDFIFEYNRDDVLVLKKIAEWLEAFSKEAKSS